jgi:hypothetical protein
VEDRRAISLFVSTEDSIFGYVDSLSLANDSKRNKDMILNSDTLIIGNNGVPKEHFRCDVSDESVLIYSSPEIMNKSRIISNMSKTYINNTVKNNFVFELN